LTCGCMDGRTVAVIQLVGSTMRDAGYRVLVVDDHPIFVRGVRNQLEDAGDIHVIGDCSNGAEAITLVEQERPDVVLIDLRIPPVAGDEAEFCGPEVIRRIVELALDTRTLVLSMHEEPEYVRAALKAGATGYLRKEEKDITHAVRTVAEGNIVLDRRTVRALLGQQAQLADGELPFLLTRAEYRMLVLMAKGLTKRQIVAELTLSDKTVANRAGEIHKKLNVSDWNEAVEKARKNGIGVEE
jgi:NarL family two-component system response regulator LiaR